MQTKYELIVKYEIQWVDVDSMRLENGIIT